MKPLHLSHMLANGDTAVLVYFKAHLQQNRMIQFLAMFLRTQKISGICEVVPASHSLQLVFSEPLDLESAIDDLSAMIRFACEQSYHENSHPELHLMKVCYDPKVAPDLEQVTADCEVTLEQLIEMHTAERFTIAMLGFLPGFTYLDGLDKRLTMPRKQQPKQNTAAGSIGIAGHQTGIYALNSPGGWHVIGRTPMPLVDWQADNPLLYKPLDMVQFKAISYQQYKDLSG